MSSTIQSAFHGAIEELPGIYVDNFGNAAKVNARAYFLSHCHADHMNGLSSDELVETLRKTEAKIYTTELSSAIIKKDVNKDIGDHVQSLKIGGTKLLNFPSIPEQNVPELFVTVTLIPAGHSAGSTMFLFKTTTKTILFTGDFRMNPNDLPKYSALHENGQPIKLDNLYVDTTFLSYNYDNFPKRSESIEKMCSEITKWLSYEQNAVALQTSAKYGYEFAFNEIYRRLGFKVHVPSERWSLYSTIQHLVPGVTNELTRIHLCNKKDNHMYCTMDNYEIWKPMVSDYWKNRFRQPFHPAWMDYCDPYHCNDYHKIACGLNRQNMRFKWFQSQCHIILNNLCSTYRGSLQYDGVETKYCTYYVMFLRTGCPNVCPDVLEPVCSISTVDNHVVLFKNDCEMEKANCRGGILEVQFIYESNCVTPVTLSQRERINILREEIKKEIRNVAGDIDDDTTMEEEDYLESQKMPITPIMEEEIEKEKYIPPSVMSKSTSKSKLTSQSKVTSKYLSKSITDLTSMSTTKPAIRINIDSRNSSLRSKNRSLIEHKKYHIRKPIEIFYRRLSYQDLIDNPTEWVHCQDMITPYLTGAKTDITHPKRLAANDPTVVRFMQLLKVDTSNYGRDDIYSILYQINNLQLRLFQWDLGPLNMLLTAIIKDHRHTFGRLRFGIREMFKNWRMDITNVTNLLKQTRIFRPPCILISKYDGSTKAPRVTKYTKKTVSTRCEEEDDDC
ncbi:unnamed protein product [Danaus chrysippus]|uniref:(African queen) hypothetical protein n=1 Tax=Danaus chrysippus TaxID=151541 RepID=A0A8J2R160_9NEOP|nr:unnamed protein product [Danaus chrysippus]